MPKPLRKPVRVAEGGLEQKRKQGEHSGHGHPGGTCATRSWRGSRRRAETVSRRARTFPRPVGRDQSQSLPFAGAFRRDLRAFARTGDPARAERDGGKCLWRAVACACRGRAAVFAPTYAEHARVAELAGHTVMEAADVAQLADSRLAIVVNPNNPDGRIVAKDMLLALADRLRRRGGLLLIDEAFMDVAAEGISVADQVGRGNIVVLRSFGKFYGLPGVRLSFALATPEIASRLAAALGPWPVSSAAVAVGRA